MTCGHLLTPCDSAKLALQLRIDSAHTRMQVIPILSLQCAHAQAATAKATLGSLAGAHPAQTPSTPEHSTVYRNATLTKCGKRAWDRQGPGDTRPNTVWGTRGVTHAFASSYTRPSRTFSSATLPTCEFAVAALLLTRCQLTCRTGLCLKMVALALSLSCRDTSLTCSR